MIKNSQQNEKFKAKLNLAFFILYNFDQHSFYTLKRFSKTNKQKTCYLRAQSERINLLIKMTSSKLIYKETFLKERDLLKIKYFLKNSFNKKFREKKNFSCINFLKAQATLKTLEEFLHL